MFKIPVALCCDAYKNSHYIQYPTKTNKVYSTWTPRKSRLPGVDKVVFFGLQYFIIDFLIEGFNETFFNRPKNEVIGEIQSVIKPFTGDDNVSRWEALHDLGYLPLEIKAVPEGTLIPIRVPMFTIENTLPEFYWLTNFVETIMSTEIWKPMTSATIALEYRKVCDKWADKTCDDGNHVDFQGHDFSMRGMAGIDAACTSGAGHLLFFKGSDTIPAAMWLNKYYPSNGNEIIGCSIPATEHSAAETNIIEMVDRLQSMTGHQIYNLLTDNHVLIPENVKETSSLYLFLMFNFISEGPDDTRQMLAEVLYLDRLLNIYKSGVFSYVSDTYNLWKVLTFVLPMLKDKIMARDGKVVIRPDSGDPADIICGYNTKTFFDDYRGIDKPYGLKSKEDTPYYNEVNKGVVELLWDTFGGTVNSKGYKVLDSHVGCIYGDAITLEKAEEICSRLESKGFASSNVVFGIGSYTYNMNTRDTFGFALKTTYGEVDGKKLLLYKDPITDDGTKKSQKGMVCVYQNEDGNITFRDNLYPEDLEGLKNVNLLKTVFKDGVLYNKQSLADIRGWLKAQRSLDAHTCC